MAKRPVGRNATYVASLKGKIKAGNRLNSASPAAFVLLLGFSLGSGNRSLEIAGRVRFAGSPVALIALFGLVFLSRSDCGHGLGAQGRDGGAGIQKAGSA